MNKTAKFGKLWKLICKKDEKLNDEEKQKTIFEREFLRKLCEKFLNLIENVQLVNNDETSNEYPIDIVNYAERFIELLTDIIVQLPTRRFFNIILDDIHFIMKCSLSKFSKSSNQMNDLNVFDDFTRKISKSKISLNENIPKETHGKTSNLFNKMLKNLLFYSNFEINDQTGETLKPNEIIEKHYDKLFNLQKSIFKYFRNEDNIFPLKNIQSIDNTQQLNELLQKLNDQQLNSLSLSLQPPFSIINNRILSIQVLIEKHKSIQNHLQVKLFLFVY